jgi:acyl transferase domain-containing protein
MSQMDIAVIGMAGRFPGARSIAEFWGNIRDGVNSIVPLTDEELLAAGVSPAELADPAYVKAAPVLDGVDQFDAKFFGLSPRDASVMDPAHRLFLELAWEAMEHAGRTALPEDGTVGVFAASGAPYYLMDHVRRNRALMRSMGEFLVRHTNNDMNFLATRVSYEMDLHGPSVNIQTACSSALVAVHMACDSIRRGECVMALAGGSTVLIPDRHGYLYQEGEIMSPDGHCRPFDARSAGTVFGSGSGCVVLKSLEKALDDGDTIHAVIKGSAINNDGARRVGFLAPGVEGQAHAVGSALDAAGVSADTITYVEAHGTATRVGDPIEIEGLAQAFAGRTQRRQFCAIGSVKSNIGHLGEAAGVASLIKAIMALKHQELPPSLGYESPNPQIDFASTPFFVNDRLRSWKSEGPRRCGVTALGAGGTNCHVILEEAPAATPGEGARAVQLFTLSAKSGDALAREREALADALETELAVDLADAAYTLAVGRRPFAERATVVARSRSEAIARLRGKDARLLVGRADESVAGVAFLFPGGGSQYAGMGRELYDTEPVYREAVDACLQIADARLGRDLGQLMFPEAIQTAQASKTLEQPSLTLPALFTTEYALARLFMAWGVEPTAFVGHSMGEYVAACLAGVMTLREALELVMLRGRLFEKTQPGGMLSVPMSETELRAVLLEGLDVAAVNAPNLCVASGPVGLLDSLQRLLTSREIESTRIRIDVAAHSRMLDPILGEFRAFCRTIAWREPSIPFVSNVTGKWMTAAQATDPEYWVQHLRSTVRFDDCLRTVRANGEVMLVEAGPGRALTTLAKAQASPARHSVSTLRHPDEPASDLEFALAALGRIWLAGVGVDWSAFYDGQLRNRVPLPTYPWDHHRHWVEAPRGLDAGDSVETEGRRERVADWFERPTWKQTLPPPAIPTTDERVLVFRDDEGFADIVVSTLRKAGRRVMIVRAGPAYSMTNEEITIRAGVAADYTALLRELTRAGTFPQRVVHMWGVTSPARRSELASTLEMGFYSLLALGQAVAEEALDVPFVLDVVTSGLQSVGAETAIDPLKALSLGPARVMPRENPVMRSRAIDIVLPAHAPQRETLARLVAAEVCAEPTDETVVFRGRERFVQALETVQLSGVASRVKEHGVYLITGGLGGIGYSVATHFAKAYRAKLVLLGRGATEAKTRTQRAALEALGAEVEVIAGDVTDVGHMRRVVARARERFGRLDGILHAAGTLGDSLMPLKSREDAARVLAPKVQGTLAIDAALGDEPIDFFVLFSSISSIAGLAGQADYTAANAFLDAFANERSARNGSFTIAVNWSAWRDVGMAAAIAAGGQPSDGGDRPVHPVLGKPIWSSAGAELFSSSLSGDSSWVIREHRVRGGRTLMPGTGYLEIARAAMGADGARPFEIRDMAFMTALVVPDSGAVEMRVQLAPAGAETGLFVATRQTSPGGESVWQEHVSANVEYVDRAAPAPLDIAAIRARCNVSEQTFAPDQTSVNMDFGPRWKNLRTIRYGRAEALVSLELPRQFESDFAEYPLHPALLDMATGRCEALAAGFDAAKDFFVPLSYTRVTMFAPLVPKIFSHVRLVDSEIDGIIVFDVTITDETGRVLVDIERFMMTRVADRRQLDEQAPRAGARRTHVSFEPPSAHAPPPPLARWLDGAIKPSEGMEALDRILAGPAISQVYATPERVQALLSRMREADVVSPPAEAKEVKLVRVSDAEGVLATHPAVDRCVVLERFDRPGNRHVVAYIVPKAGEDPTVSELRRFAKKGLAASSAPGTILILESFPKTREGDVDLGALHDPFGLADDHIAPRNETESTIAGIWRDALGLAKVGVRDNFFDIGGHSLLAIRAIVKTDKALGVRLPQTAMVMQTLEQIAAEVDRQREARANGGAAAGGRPTTAGEPAAASGGFLRSIREAIGGNNK